MKKTIRILIICAGLLLISGIIAQFAPKNESITVQQPEVKLFPVDGEIAVSSNSEYEASLHNARSDVRISPSYFEGDLWVREKSTGKEVLIGKNSFDRNAAGNPIVSTMIDPATKISYAFIDQGTGTSSRGGTIVNFAISKALNFSYARDPFIAKIHDRSYLVMAEPSEFWQRLVDTAMHNIVVVELDTLTPITLLAADKYTTYAVAADTHTITKIVFSHNLIDGTCTDCYDEQTKSNVGKLEDLISRN